MKALVLAAGTGSRLGPITREKTKGMVKVSGKRLIDYLFDFLSPSRFSDVFVVGGFYYQDLKKHIDGRGFKNVSVLENEDYLKGNIFTLKRGLREFSGESFLITNVDHIYPEIMFDTMQKSFSSITAMCDYDRNIGDDDMKVKLRSNGNSIKGISKQLDDFDCGYIGMTYVDSSMDVVYRKSVEETIVRFGEKAVVENILQLLSEDEKTAPAICDLSGFGWYEVDNEEDLRNAEKGLKTNKNFPA